MERSINQTKQLFVWLDQWSSGNLLQATGWGACRNPNAMTFSVWPHCQCRFIWPGTECRSQKTPAGSPELHAMLWDPRCPAYLPHLIWATITAICEAAGKQMLFFHLWNQAVGMESGLWAPSPKGQILKWQCCLCRAPRFVSGTLSLETGGSFHNSKSRNKTPFWSSRTSHLLHRADYINSSTTEFIK